MYLKSAKYESPFSLKQIISLPYKFQNKILRIGYDNPKAINGPKNIPPPKSVPKRIMSEIGTKKITEIKAIKTAIIGFGTAFLLMVKTT